MPLSRLGVFMAILLGAISSGAAEPPACRVRFVKAAAAERVPASIVKEVESWIEAGARGCALVPSIADADLALEFRGHSYRIEADGAPIETWYFVARRLGETDPHQGVHRFALSAIGRGSKDGVLGRMPVKLRELLGEAPSAPAKGANRI